MRGKEEVAPGATAWCARHRRPGRAPARSSAASSGCAGTDTAAWATAVTDTPGGLGKVARQGDDGSSSEEASPRAGVHGRHVVGDQGRGGHADRPLAGTSPVPVRRIRRQPMEEAQAPAYPCPRVSTLSGNPAHGCHGGPVVVAFRRLQLLHSCAVREEGGGPSCMNSRMSPRARRLLSHPSRARVPHHLALVGPETGKYPQPSPPTSRVPGMVYRTKPRKSLKHA